MSTRLQIIVYENRQMCQSAEFEGPVELGRQRDRDEALYARRQEGGLSRWVIARRSEITVGRSQLTVTALPDGCLRVKNGSDRQPIRFFEHPDLAPQATCELALPVIVVLSNNKTIRIEKATPLQTLAIATPPPRSALAEMVSGLPTLAGFGDVLPRDRVLEWLSRASELLQTPASRPEYLAVVARVTADTVGLDAARALTFVSGEWQVRAVQVTGRLDPGDLAPPSSRILGRVAAERRTFWETPDIDSTASFTGLQAVAAAPILSGTGEVIGALYGERRRTLRVGEVPLGELEARLIEMLARIVAGTLAREGPAGADVQAQEAPPAQEAYASSEFGGLPDPTTPPLSHPGAPPDAEVDAPVVSSPELLRSLNAALDILQAAAHSDHFFERAARAAVQMGDLDESVVLIRDGGEWVSQAEYSKSGSMARPFSQRLLSRVLETKTTSWERPKADAVHSFAGLAAAVAAPILSREGEIVGLIFASRRRASGMGGPSITEVQALLVELVARSVAAGLARLEVEREAARAEALARFRPFFADETLIRVVETGLPLTGRNATVSVLFCDIRGFTRISQRIGAERTDEFCRALLDELSRSVLDRQGVLVDFIGDGLMAMWGAPGEQPDHAARAVAAARDMLAAAETFSASWSGTLGETLRLGIGIHTGEAQVGNTGSSRKPKYGPRGPTVNLASRIEGATKHFDCPLLITGATREALGGTAPSRALGPVRVVGVETAIELHQVPGAGIRDWDEGCRIYESAFAHFSEARFSETFSLLGPWVHRAKWDGPALKLLGRAVSALAIPPGPDHPVWILGQK